MLSAGLACCIESPFYSKTSYCGQSAQAYSTRLFYLFVHLMLINK